ncbi:MAG: 50S ribosomal protein L13 [Candidatus Thorarchaeota archaeon]
MSSNHTVIDAEGAILGRLASVVAKRLLTGETIDIVNVEKIVISGKPEVVIAEYKEKLGIRSKYNPLRGPFHYRIPDRFVRRTIRGMLPYKKPNGKDAFHRLKCHISVPEQFAKEKLIKLSEADSAKLTVKRISVAELCAQLGWNYNPDLDPRIKQQQ